MIHALFSSTINLIQRSLDLRQQRHTVLSSNIANVETPGFIAKDLQFEDALKRSSALGNQRGMQHTHTRHLSQSGTSVDQIQGQLLPIPSDDIGRDFNTVSVDREMASLMTNALHYNASTEMISRMFANLRQTINEGRP